MSKFLVIAEKPSVAQSYAKNLSAYKKEDGYLEGESCIVSWCLGHLAEYAQPEEYDPKYEKWQFDDLPILPQVWKLKVSRDKKKQFDVLKSLMNRADVDYLVNGCDAGREGELIFQKMCIRDRIGCFLICNIFRNYRKPSVCQCYFIKGFFLKMLNLILTFRKHGKRWRLHPAHNQTFKITGRICPGSVHSD